MEGCLTSDPNANKFARIQLQDWKKYIRCLIVTPEASVQLEIYKTKQWFGGNVFLYSLYTDNERRGSGHGNTIMNIAESKVKELGYSEIFLELGQHCKDFVLQWYHKRGYIDVGSPRGVLLLRKDL